MRIRTPRITLLAAAVTLVGAMTAGPAAQGLSSSPARAADAEAVTPLPGAHAHNDYLNSSPVTGALGHGFTSLEADVYLRVAEGPGAPPTLVLCHQFKDNTCYDDEERSKPAASFVQTYLTGLQTWVNDHGGRVYPGYAKPIHLLVEIKCKSAQINGRDTCTDDGTNAVDSGSVNNPINVLLAIESALQPYHSMLYSDANTTGPIQVIVTGGHNTQTYTDPRTGGRTTTTVRDALRNPSPHWVYLDGSLGSDYDTTDDFVPLVSFGYPATIQDSNLEDHQKCGLNPDQELIRNDPIKGTPITANEVDEILDAHAHGRQVRVWDLPDCPSRTTPTDTTAYREAREEAWRDAHFAGADYISSNHLQYLQDWLLANDNQPGFGGGACGDLMKIPAGVHHVEIPAAQHCSMWTGNVNVYSRPDINSAPAGQLIQGGSANWFIGQRRGVDWQYPGKPWSNDWYAYTEADNGAWGWVPVVYFSGGSNEMPADRLASCNDVKSHKDICYPYN